MGYVDPEEQANEVIGRAAALRNFEEACCILALVGSYEQRRIATDALREMREAPAPPD